MYRADMMIVKHLGVIDLPTLRAERQRLSQESARMVWLRRLIVARRDLEVARLMGAGAGPWGAAGVEPMLRDALGDRPCPGLLHELSQSLKAVTIAADGARRDLEAATNELVGRYRAEPGLCLRASNLAVLVDACE